MPLVAIMRSPREVLSGAGQRHAVAALAKCPPTRLVVTDARLAADDMFRAMMTRLQDRGPEVRVDAGTLPDVPVSSAIGAAKAGSVHAVKADA